MLRETRIEPICASTAQERSKEPDGCGNDEVAAAREIRLFQAHLREALDSAIETLCDDIAADVVGRELQLAPADIKEIVKRALDRFAAEGPVCVRVHPDDRDALSADVPSAADCTLRRGDAILAVRSGEIDISLGVRLDSILRAVR